MARKTFYITIPEDQLDKWKQLWQPKDAHELGYILDIDPCTIRAIIKRGTIANQDMLDKIDSYYNQKLFILNQYE